MRAVLHGKGCKVFAFPAHLYHKPAVQLQHFIGISVPMEITIDGYTIVLGQTTMKEMTDLGYEAGLTAMPDTVSRGDKYIPFYYSLSLCGRKLRFPADIAAAAPGHIDSHKQLVACSL